jgi:hypothetical protein
MMHHKTATSLDVNLPADEGKGRRRGQHHVASAHFGAGGAHHVVEVAGFGQAVVGTACGGQVLVVRAAIKNHMAGGGDLAGEIVVRHFVCFQRVAAETDLDVAVQPIDVVLLLLSIRLDGDGFARVQFAGVIGLFRQGLGINRSCLGSTDRRFRRLQLAE